MKSYDHLYYNAMLAIQDAATTSVGIYFGFQVLFSSIFITVSVHLYFIDTFGTWRTKSDTVNEVGHTTAPTRMFVQVGAAKNIFADARLWYTENTINRRMVVIAGRRSSHYSLGRWECHHLWEDRLMPTFGPIKRRELIAAFHRLGFTGPHPGTKHDFMAKGDIRVRIPNLHQGSIGVSLPVVNCEFTC